MKKIFRRIRAKIIAIRSAKDLRELSDFANLNHITINADGEFFGLALIEGRPIAVQMELDKDCKFLLIGISTKTAKGMAVQGKVKMRGVTKEDILDSVTRLSLMALTVQYGTSTFH